MKKILGISLCALFAVSAANAEIASTEWVNQKVSGLAVGALGDRVTQNEEDIDSLQETAGRLGTAAYTSADAYATTAQGAKADTAVQEVVEGGTNGTISVDGTEVAVHGLGSAAYTNANAYATTAQGAKADTAVQEVVSGTANGTIKVDGTDVRVTGLQDLAYQSTIADADVAQNAAIASSKIAFDSTQTAVFGSGITSDLVGKITDNEGAIAINKTNIQSNSDNIVTLKGRVDGHDTSIGELEAIAGRLGSAAYTESSAYATTAQGAKADTAVQDVTTGTTNGTIKVDTEEVAVAGLDALAYKATVTDVDIAQNAAIKTSKIAFTDAEKAALGSTITAAKVGQIDTNTDSIGNIQDFLDTMINEAPGYADCKNSTYGCTLVVKGGAFLWEKVTRAE